MQDRGFGKRVDGIYLLLNKLVLAGWMWIARSTLPMLGLKVGGKIPRVNFTNILRTAFLCEDPKSAKKDSQLRQLLAISGSARVKAAPKHVDEIDPGSSKILKVLKVSCIPLKFNTGQDPIT